MLSQVRAARLFTLLFFLFALVQLLLLKTASFNLAPDEAHYWEWARHPDFSYYSKGPLIAYLIAHSTRAFGINEFGVRFPAWVCGTIFSVVFFLFALEISSAQVALMSWLAIQATLFFFTMPLVMTTDPPAILFWMLSIYFAYFAIYKKRNFYWWQLGISIALGTAAKYTVALLYPVIGACLVSSRYWRKLFHPFFLLGIISFAFLVFPIIYWNMEHGWVNFSHNAGHIYKPGESIFHPRYFLELLGGQLGLAGPALLCAAGMAFFRYRPVGEDAGARILGATALALLALCVLLSLTRPVYANWPMPGYVSGILFTAYLYQRGGLPINVSGWQFKVAVGLSALIFTVGLFPIFGFTLGIPGKYLPTKKLVGWHELGLKVEEQLQSAASAGDNLAVIAEDYGTASEIAFYAPSHPRVYCANTGGRRMNQYDIWGGWQRLRRRDALIVVKDPKTISEIESYFTSVERIVPPNVFSANPEPMVRVEYSGSLIREFYFFIGRNYDGREPPLPEKR